MSIKQSGLVDSVGKTIEGFIIVRADGMALMQLHIAFTDGTSIEVWGRELNCSRMRDDSLDDAERYGHQFGDQVTRIGRA